MKGIYKIESPNGKLYFGQSIDLNRRFRDYKFIRKANSSINKSLLKYGYSAHKFSIVYELPDETSKEVLTNYEQFFIDQFKEAGYKLLNISPTAGSPAGIKRSEAQKRRHSEFMKGRPSPRKGQKLSEKTKALIKEKRALQKNVKPVLFKKGQTPWNKGLKMGPSPNIGKKLTEETKEKIRQKLLGSKLSAETIAKRTATLKINGVKRKWSEEAKKRQSLKYLGKKKSEKTIMKGRVTRLKNKKK